MKHFIPNTNVMLNANTFINKNILVTGGGTGLGKQIATFFAHLNGNVTIMSRNEKVLKDAKYDIEKKTQKHINYKICDISKYSEINNLITNYHDKNFPDIIINNSAANFAARTEKLTINGIDKIIDTVLKGTTNMTIFFGKQMILKKKSGVFVNISATYGATGSGLVVPSSISKAGCDNLVKSLAAEWGPNGMRFVGIAPGPIWTKGAFSNLDPDNLYYDSLKNNIPLQRFGKTEELANLVTYVASDYGNWLNGTIINFDGGETVKNSGQFNKFI